MFEAGGLSSSRTQYVGFPDAPSESEARTNILLEVASALLMYLDVGIILRETFSWLNGIEGL